jgi:L-threonylcarbamoyladenylate synthase
MQIINSNNLNIVELVDHLNDGMVIVYPTETCYGLGCDAMNVMAVNKIFSIKKRQRDKSVLIIASDVPMVREYVYWNETIQTLADRYWPGPLTIVAQAKVDSGFPDGVIHEDGSVAFRVTDHPIASSIVRELGRPIISTSANISAMASPYDIDAVLTMFRDVEDKPDIIIDGGSLPHRLPSTIVRLNGGELEILRQGELLVQL